MPNPIVWWELASHDQEKSVKFFQDVFDWDLNLNKAGFYTIKHDPPQITGGGIFTLKRAKLPFVSLYIQVDDIQKMAKRLKSTAAWSKIRPSKLPLAPGFVSSMSHRGLNLR